jgi:hypothetical protein
MKKYMTLMAGLFLGCGTLAIASVGSFYNEGTGSDGYTHCYQYTPSGQPLNTGATVPNSYCGG